MTEKLKGERGKDVKVGGGGGGRKKRSHGERQKKKTFLKT